MNLNSYYNPPQPGLSDPAFKMLAIAAQLMQIFNMRPSQALAITKDNIENITTSEDLQILVQEIHHARSTPHDIG